MRASVINVAPPRLTLTATAFVLNGLPSDVTPSSTTAKSTGTRGLRGRCEGASPFNSSFIRLVLCPLNLAPWGGEFSMLDEEGQGLVYSILGIIVSAKLGINHRDTESQRKFRNIR